MNSKSNGDYEEMKDDTQEAEIIPTHTMHKPTRDSDEPAVVQKSKFWVVTAILSGISFGI